MNSAPRPRARRSCIGLALLGLAVRGAAQGPPLPAGMTPTTQASVQRGLEWLVRAQDGHGAWRDAGGHGGAPVPMTSLAGMAFVANGSTPTRGAYWQQVRGAVDYLLAQADGDTGLIAVRGEDAVPMFGHGFATMFLASVFGMEEDVAKQQRLQATLQRAVRLIESAQSVAGGWYYTPGANDDEGSVTVTQLQALRACSLAGIQVDARTIARAVDYLRRCQNDDGGIRYRLGAPGESRPAITAAGITALYSAGVYDDQAFVDKAHRYCQRTLQVRVDTTGHHGYAHHYWSQALYQRGGREWDDYYPGIAAWLLEHQARDGSWEGDGVGRVYGTAIALQTLQLPLALVPIHQR